jgi:hypothetical protein
MFLRHNSKCLPDYRAEHSGELKGLNDLIQFHARDLPACSIVPHPTTLPGALVLICSADSTSNFDYTFRLGTSPNYIHLPTGSNSVGHNEFEMFSKHELFH